MLSRVTQGTGCSSRLKRRHSLYSLSEISPWTQPLCDGMHLAQMCLKFCAAFETKVIVFEFVATAIALASALG